MIVLLNPVFNCSKSLFSFSADRVTTGTYNFVSFIFNVAPVVLLLAFTPGAAFLVALLVTTQFSDQVKVKVASQLINGMFSILQKLLKYFSGTAISTSLVLLLSLNFPVILVL